MLDRLFEKVGMKVEIKDVAEILLGTFQKPSRTGNILFLLLSHFDDDGNMRPEEYLSFIEEGSTPQQRLLRKGDILVVAKGGRNFAALYNPDIGPAVASSAFLILRVTSPDVLPEYLAVYLNLRRSDLAALAGGTSMPSISKGTLSAFKVSIPSLERQEEIVYLNKLWKQEKALMQQIIEEKTVLYQMLLLHTAETPIKNPKL